MLPDFQSPPGFVVLRRPRGTATTPITSRPIIDNRHRGATSRWSISRSAGRQSDRRLVDYFLFFVLLICFFLFFVLFFFRSAPPTPILRVVLRRWRRFACKLNIDGGFFSSVLLLLLFRRRYYAIRLFNLSGNNHLKTKQQQKKSPVKQMKNVRRLCCARPIGIGFRCHLLNRGPWGAMGGVMAPLQKKSKKIKEINKEDPHTHTH